MKENAHTRHRVRLARARLTVGENASVDALSSQLCEVLALLEDSRLRSKVIALQSNTVTNHVINILMLT